MLILPLHLIDSSLTPDLSTQVLVQFTGKSKDMMTGPLGPAFSRMTSNKNTSVCELYYQLPIFPVYTIEILSSVISRIEGLADQGSSMIESLALEIVPDSDTRFQQLYFDRVNRPGDRSFHLFSSMQVISSTHLSDASKMVAFTIMCYKMCEDEHFDLLGIASDFFHARIAKGQKSQDSDHPRKDSFHLQCSSLCAYIHLASRYSLKDEFVASLGLLSRIVHAPSNSYFTASYPLIKICSFGYYISFLLRDYFGCRVFAVLAHYLFLASVNSSSHRRFALYDELKNIHAVSTAIQKCHSRCSKLGWDSPRTQTELEFVFVNTTRVGKITSNIIKNNLVSMATEYSDQLTKAVNSFALEICSTLSIDDQLIKLLYVDKGSKPEQLMLEALKKSHPSIR